VVAVLHGDLFVITRNEDIWYKHAVRFLKAAIRFEQQWQITSLKFSNIHQKQDCNVASGNSGNSE